ncbi:nitroreductase [Alkaliphilus metalliredigens QYMF]|uniref:Nitroreductase n=1 Tax=Alkaliphilus metalliredigens (strain QYMF) TaxID=293826 RepID=A6TUE8_ALKMQ|nr:nitroreductase family protein [Alkaliphilus metalliredigens]ABR49816.1 nitroreductase [Alkaliphilus metalliredigens QYMF]
MLALLKKRRSIRKFKFKKVSTDQIEQLVQGALLSPTSKNRRPWEFIVVTEEKGLTALSKSKTHGAQFLEGAPLAIVIIGDPEVSDVWIEDTSIASILIQMTAESLELGSCWIQIRERFHNDKKSAEDYVKEVLSIPAAKRVASIIAIGHPDEEKKPHSEENLLYEKVYHNRYHEDCRMRLSNTPNIKEQ